MYIKETEQGSFVWRTDGSEYLLKKVAFFPTAEDTTNA